MNPTFSADDDPPVALSNEQRGQLQQAWSNGMANVRDARQRRTDEAFLAELLDHGRDPRGRLAGSPFLAELLTTFVGPFRPVGEETTDRAPAGAEQG